VITYDPLDRPERSGLERVSPAVRGRTTNVASVGSSDPPPGLEVELLYIDSSHSRGQTLAELAAWCAARRSGAVAATRPRVDFLHHRYR
jgi:hypothetical protein